MVIKLTWGIKNALIYKVFKHIGYFTLTYIFRNKHWSWVKATFILVENIGFSKHKQTKIKHFISFKHCHLNTYEIHQLKCWSTLSKFLVCPRKSVISGIHFAFDEGMLRRQFNLVFWHHIVIEFWTCNFWQM